MRRLRSFCAVLSIIISAGAAEAWNRSSADDYGRVVINNHSRRSGTAPVIFDHWVHRARFTCRLCHIDIGFAMEKNGSDITASMNRDGFYCGSCHDGKRSFDGRIIFAACSEDGPEDGAERCKRCHAPGKKAAGKHDFADFAQKMPQEPFGNGINWEEAEAKGLIKPVDFLEGISIKRAPLKARDDFSVAVKASWIGEVIFSHKKHAVWNGCEVCHPEIFPSVRKGTVRYSMFEIAEGRFCGVCHDRVAFPLLECRRCHSKPVEMMP